MCETHVLKYIHFYLICARSTHSKNLFAGTHYGENLVEAPIRNHGYDVSIVTSQEP